MPAGAETDDRRHRELDRQREMAASMDAEKQAAALRERYGRSRAAAVDSVIVPQRLLLPDVNSPTIWALKCKPGKEKEVIYSVMKRFEERLNTREPIRITSAFERGSTPMAGYIYVEAWKLEDVMAATDGVSFVYRQNTLIHTTETPELLRVTQSKMLEPGMYVRMKRPQLYQGDLAYVEEVEANGLDVKVRLIPRLDYGQNEDVNAPIDSAKRKRMAGPMPRPPQRLFNENEAKKKHMKFLSQNNSITGRQWTYKNDTYTDGFLVKYYKISYLQTEDVNPKLEEVTKFAQGGEDGTGTLDISALANTLKSNTSGALYLPGDYVEIYQGEQQGLSGKAINVHGDIVTIQVTEGELKGQVVEAPAKGLRKVFREGDHVKVVGGSKYQDEIGMVIRIKDEQVTILSDSNNQEITVFSKDLRQASAAASGPLVSKYDLYDLIQLE